jgi:hypothetical protein
MAFTSPNAEPASASISRKLSLQALLAASCIVARKQAFDLNHLAPQHRPAGAKRIGPLLTHDFDLLTQPQVVIGNSAKSRSCLKFFTQWLGLRIVFGERLKSISWGLTVWIGWVGWKATWD